MSEKKIIDKEAVEELRAELQSGLTGPSVREKPLSIRQTILSLMPEILARRANGMNLADMVKLFAQNGIITTPQAISSCIGVYKKKHPNTGQVVIPAVSLKVGASSFKKAEAEKKSGEPKSGSNSEFLPIVPDL